MMHSSNYVGNLQCCGQTTHIGMQHTNWRLDMSLARLDQKLRYHTERENFGVLFYIASIIGEQRWQWYSSNKQA